MKTNKLVLGLITVLICVAGISFYYSHTKNGSLASTTLKTETSLVWQNYSNPELGIALSYPVTKDGPFSLRVGNGDTGKQVYGSGITLPSGSQIQIVGMTKDYTAPKDALTFATEGFTIKNGEYYYNNRGTAGHKISVDDFWTIADGSKVPVVYAKGDYSGSDFVPPSIAVLVNVNGKPFTGMGFALYTRGDAQPTSEDIEVFKKMIGSIVVIR